MKKAAWSGRERNAKDVIAHHAAILFFGVLRTAGPVKKKSQMNWTDRADTGFLCREPEIAAQASRDLKPD